MTDADGIPRTEPPAVPVRVAVVMMSTVGRRGLESVFDETAGIEVVQMGLDADDLGDLTPEQVDVILYSIIDPTEGIEGVRRLAARGHRVLAGGFPTLRDAALDAGALEFLPSVDAEPDALARALVRVATEELASAGGPARLRLAVVVNDEVGRRGLSGIFDEVDGYRVVATVADPGDLPRDLDVDAVLLGLGPRGKEAERLERARALGAPVLCFGLGPARAAAMAGGAAGFMRGAEITTQIFTAVDSVARGEIYSPASHADLSAVLSAREREVIEHVARGCTDREIGDRLGISMRTVQSHLDRIREKTGRRRRAELTMLAIEMGMASDGR